MPSIVTETVSLGSKSNYSSSSTLVEFGMVASTFHIFFIMGQILRLPDIFALDVFIVLSEVCTRLYRSKSVL